MKGSETGTGRPLLTLAVLMTALTVVRIMLARRFDLSPDEAYYYSWSLVPAAGYHDHPPMVAWFIHVSTMVFGKSELAIRAPAIIAGFLSPFLLCLAAMEAGAIPAAALAASVLLVLTPMASAGSVIMTPDTPLTLFWTAALIPLVRLARRGEGMTVFERTAAALTAGSLIGLAMLSKYTAGLLALSALLCIPFSPAKRRDFFYICLLPGITALVVFLPNLLYNFRSDFSTMGFQWRHVFPFKEGDDLRHFPEFLGGQIALAGPFLFAGLTAAIGLFFKAGVPAERRFLQIASILPFMVPAFAALFGKVEPNWPAPAFIALMPLLSVSIPEKGAVTRKMRKLSAAALVYGVAAVTLIHVHSFMPVVPIPISRDPVLQQTSGWREMTGDIAKVVEEIPDSGKRLPVTFSYRLSAELFYYQGDRMATLCMDRRFLKGDGDVPLNGAERWIAIEQYPSKKSDAVMKTVCTKGHRNSGVIARYGDQVLRRVDIHWCDL
jgi:4-amino-4-deoxy-L-arabinose transferase-like glycosyltransferase